MDREQTIIKFQQEAEPRILKYREQMGQHLLEQAEQLEEKIKRAMDLLGENIKRQQKEYVSFLYISMLKVDFANRSYQFLLHAMDHRWYLDEEPLEVYFDAGNIMDPLDELWDYLADESLKYIGVINRYDIQNLMFDELQHVDAAISRILRYRLRDWEKKGIFSNVILAPYWLLKWGEYRDQTEFIIQTDRVPKAKDIWKKETKMAEHKPETLVFSYWYQGEYIGNRLKKLDMKFVVFEEAALKNITFIGCDMEGSRFINSNLTECSFEGCNLWGADFTSCTFEQVSFQGAELTGALFPAQCIPFLNLSPEQLQVILLRREEQA